MISVFKAINRWERRNVKRKHYKSTWYFFVKLMLLLPLLLVNKIMQGAAFIYNLSRGRVNRTSKPDIVFSNIIAGFAGLAFPNEKTEALATRRAEVCAQCPSAVESGLYTAIHDKRTTKIQGMRCDECGCNLSAKVRSVNDYCPLGKW